jgi:outer membrane protein TolC
MRIRTLILAIGSMIAVFLVVTGVQAQEAVRQVTLEEALGLAERNNPTLEQSASSVDIAGYQELTAWGSFLPNLSLSYGYSDATRAQLDPTGQAITTTSYSAQLRGSVDLFRGFRRFSDLKGAKLGVEASEAAYREAEFTTSEGVKISYYNAVANRELVQVEQDRVRRQEDQLAVGRAALAGGPEQCAGGAAECGELGAQQRLRAGRGGGGIRATGAGGDGGAGGGAAAV